MKPNVPLSLGAFVQSAEDLEVAHLALKAKAPFPPKLIENLRRLRTLELLTDEVVLSLLAQAPIDPLGIYGAMKHMGVWAFSPVDFTMVQILAKKGDTPVALMRIDLMSDDIAVVALKDKQLVVHSRIGAEDIADLLGNPGASEGSVMAFIQRRMKSAIEEGLRNAP